MYADPNNPFAAAAVQPQSNGNSAPNPFQAASPAREDSPFAGVGDESPFGLVDSGAGRPAKLPERRFPEASAQNGAANGQATSNGASPFERASSPQGSPFEPVVAGASEGFLAERPSSPGSGGPFQAVEQSTGERPAAQQAAPQPQHQAPQPQYQAPQPQYQAPPQQQPQHEAPAAAPQMFQQARPEQAPAQRPSSDPFAPVNPVDTAFAPVSPPPSQANGNNGLAAYANGNPGPSAAPAPAPQNEFVVPAATPVQAAPAPVQAKQEVAPARQVSPHQGPSQVAHAGTPQLVLRAIFGVNHELTADEMLQRARTLPGVRNLRVVGSEEANAMRVLRNSVSQMGFGDEHSIGLSSTGGDVDIIEEEGKTLAVLHEDGGYAAGVRETLIIVTRELARLTS
ncbi:MAG: hypothetical protein ACSHYF_08460 [Verrucomicrobiaceae bacterium]